MTPAGEEAVREALDDIERAIEQFRIHRMTMNQSENVRLARQAVQTARSALGAKPAEPDERGSLAVSLRNFAKNRSESTRKLIERAAEVLLS